MVSLSFRSPSFGPGTHRNAPRRSWVGGAIATFFAEWHARKATRALEGLSDEMLHDIGVARTEIDAAVRYGRRRRV